jgi:peptide/nickel transport system permease protein
MPEPRFTDIDFESESGGVGLSLTASAVLGAGLVALAALFVYDYAIDPDLVAFRQLDWPLVVALLFVVVYGIVPLVRKPALARDGMVQLASDHWTLVSVVVSTGLFLIGLLGPFFISEPKVNISHGQQPPVWMTVRIEQVSSCTGEVVDGLCHGTWRFPLGTARGGYDVLVWSVYGLRVVSAVVLVGGLVIAGVGTMVGALTGYFGGRLDEVLMRYVDVQQVIPAFLVYVVLRLVLEGSLFTLVFVFGLLNWGGTARLVRSETRALKESGFVTASRAAGASKLSALRSHILPNVAGAALTSTSNRVGALVLAEASLSFLNLGPPQAYSLGRLAAIGLPVLRAYPWISTVPVAVLAVVALTLGVVGEGVRSAFDPRA